MFRGRVRLPSQPLARTLQTVSCAWLWSHPVTTAYHVSSTNAMVNPQPHTTLATFAAHPSCHWGGTGRQRSSQLPSPSCPCSPQPQLQAPPLLSRAHECSAPALMYAARTPCIPGTSSGDATSSIQAGGPEQAPHLPAGLSPTLPPPRLWLLGLLLLPPLPPGSPGWLARPTAAARGGASWTGAAA